MKNAWQRRGMLPALRPAALGVGLMAISTSVWAGPGDGIRVGQLQLSPGVQLGTGFDSNIARLTNDSGDAASGFLEIRPFLLAGYKSDKVRAQLSYDQTARVYPNSAAFDYSYLSDLTNKAEVEILPERPFGLTVRNVTMHRPLARRDNSDLDYVEPGIADKRYSRTLNDFTVEGRYSPGSALDLNLGLHLYYENIDLVDDEGVANTTKTQPGVELRGQWWFFPKTALTLEANFDYGTWSNLPECVNSRSNSCGSSQQNTKSTTVPQWSVLSGVGGQFTETIEANVFLGYGGLYNSDAASPVNITGLDGLLVQTQLIWRPRATQALSVGFLRRFTDSAVNDIVHSDMFTAGYSGTYFSRLGVNAGLGLEARRWALSTSPATPGEATVLSLNAGVDYRVTRWLSVNGSYRTVNSFSDIDNYTQHLILLGVRGLY